MRNAYRSIIPRIYQDIFTDKFKELMRKDLAQLIGPDGEKKLGKSIDQLADGELAYALEQAQKGKLQLAPPKPPKIEEKAEADLELFGEPTQADIAAEQAMKKKEQVGAAAPKPQRDSETIRTIVELYHACHEDFKLQPKAVLKELGYSSQTDINETPAECYRKILAVRG